MANCGEVELSFSLSSKGGLLAKKVALVDAGFGARRHLAVSSASVDRAKPGHRQ